MVVLRTYLSTTTWRTRFFILLVPSITFLLYFFNFRSRDGPSDLEFVDHAPADTTVTTLPNILLVSAFFPASSSKHTMREYEIKLTSFLSRVSTDVYFYVGPEMEPLIRRCRSNLTITIDTSYTSPFDTPPLTGLQDRYKEMRALERGGSRHSPDLYARRNAKPFLLDAAMQKMAATGKQYDYAFWTDADSFRSSHRYSSWPDPKRVNEIWTEGAQLTHQRPEDLLFFPLAGVPHSSMRFWMQDHGPVDSTFSEGSFFGGSAKTIAWWKRTYYAYHDHYLSLGMFVGSDQTLANALLLLFPERVVGVWAGDPNAAGYKEGRGLGACGDEWYYYQFWLSSTPERAAMRAVFKPHWWTFNRNREACHLADVAAVPALLQRQFRSWNPPMHTIDA